MAVLLSPAIAWVAPHSSHEDCSWINSLRVYDRPGMSGDEQRRAAWRALVETHGALMERLAAEMRDEVSLPMTWYDVLLHLSDPPADGMRMNALAQAVVISKSGLTRVVDGMEEAGLLAREPIRGDRRSTAIRVTPEGGRRFAEARAVHRRGIREHFSRHLSEDEARTLLEVMARVREAEVPPAPRP
jgi:DNA-binding MarR family transcriptional regulator